MRLTVSVGLFSCIAFTSIFFQNCSRYNPELNASSSYTAKAESVVDTSQDAAIGSDLQNAEISSVQQSQSISNEPSFSISFSLTSKRLSELASFQCRVNNDSWKACQSPLVIDGLPDGSHSLAIKAVYKNYESAAKEIFWVKDTQSPNLVFNQAPPNTIGTTDVSITFSGGDSGSGIKQYKCVLDDSEWKECQSPIRLEQLAEGSHSLLVHAIDKAGNVAEISKTWNVNLTFPYIDLINAPAAFIKSSEVQFHFQIKNGLDFNSFECQFNNASVFSPCQSGIVYPVSEDGNYVFRVRAKNSQEFYTSTTSYTVTRDTAAPSIDIARSVTGTAVTSNSILNASVSDGPLGSGIKNVSCSYSSTSISGTIRDCQFPLDMSQYGVGSFTVTITATDNIGNSVTSEPEAILVIPPEIELPPEQI